MQIKYFHTGKVFRLLLIRFNKIRMQHHFVERRLSKLNTILKGGGKTRRNVEIISVMGQLWCYVQKDK